MDVGSVYGSYYETAKSYMGLRKEEKQAGFAEKVTDKSQVSSEDMTLEEYKEKNNGFKQQLNIFYNSKKVSGSRKAKCGKVNRQGAWCR